MTTRRAEGEVERLAALPWTTELKRNEDGSVFARIVELPGCMTEGETEEEAVRNLREALGLWLDSELAQGHPIPRPESKRYSGTFTVRTSPWLHRLATEAARRENVSLNEFVNEAVAVASGGAAAFRVGPSAGSARYDVRFEEWMRKSDRDVFLPYPRLRLWIDGEASYVIHGLLTRLDAEHVRSTLWRSPSASDDEALANMLARFFAQVVEEAVRESALPRGYTRSVQRLGIRHSKGVRFAATLEQFLRFAGSRTNRRPVQKEEILHSFELMGDDAGRAQRRGA
ncbi:MAG: toxin-antitoxin system HicB family antitoxin [Acidimicrobiia bacterium]